jgi:poly-gamma-glutamate biosynthesis protein PgsC/CapC
MLFESLLIGIVVAVLYVEIMDVYPGGIIVPAYFAAYLDQPTQLLITLLAAALGLVSYRFLSRYLILFGKRRFVTMILLGVFWAQVCSLILPHVFSSGLDLRAIGWIIPGLLANNLEKQRIIPTAASLFTVAVITYFLVQLVS